MTEPTAPNDAGDEQVTVTMHWPADTYRNAKPANSFVFTDNSDSVCIAFGFMAPPPNIKELAAAAAGQTLHFTIDQHDAFVVSRQMLVQIQQELTKYIAVNAHLFPSIVQENDTNADPA